MFDKVVMESGTVVCTYSGDVTLDELLGAIKQYLTHPDCSQFRYVLHDFSKVKSFQYIESDFSNLATYAMENYQDNDQVQRFAITKSESIRRSLVLYGELTGRHWNFVGSPEEIIARKPAAGN